MKSLSNVYAGVDKDKTGIAGTMRVATSLYTALQTQFQN
jgi:hypothetical protein